ncbi:FHA domain-containing protein [Motiliproteus sp. MSK22-1]|uniref:FHA domain-containing protein n=1 Tax=Motiliproteus sp. MSK22-1 TaxID=1897630 RepID=UPI0013011F3C|nr:FHA domain-containing protein [Motiliproteus sp. MSK22-1]
MFELRVLTGLHQSASLPLIGNQWLIGASEDCDLSLFDPGVKSTHLTLFQEGENWLFKDLQGSVKDRDGHLLDETQMVATNSPFQLAGVWLTICSAELAWEEMQGQELSEAAYALPARPSHSPASGPFTPQPESAEIPTLYTTASLTKSDEKKRRPMMLGLAALVAAIVTTSAWALSVAKDTSQLQKLEKITNPGLRVRNYLEGTAQVKTVLDGMLQQREITEVSVHISGTTVSLQGEVDKPSKERIQRMLRRFNKEHNTSTTVIDAVSIKTHELPFRIVQITSGSMSHIVTSKGQRLFVGDELDGVRLLSISSNRIEFGGKQNIEVTW